MAPSKTNKLLAKLLCASLWRKGALCCTMSCSCFNDVENPEAERQRAEEARWKYKSEKLAVRQESKEKAQERRKARKEKAKTDREARQASSIEKRVTEKQSTNTSIGTGNAGMGTEQAESREASGENDAIGHGQDAAQMSDNVEREMDGPLSNQGTPGRRRGKGRRAKRAAAKHESRRH